MEIPMDDMQGALRDEMDTVRRSIRYCREELGIKKDDG
jgi:hypothetical protein